MGLKIYLNIRKYGEKFKVLIFRKLLILWQFPENSKNYFHTYLLAYSMRFFALDYL